ncbi:MAG: DNA internalization-related competence protein ComEC/Rec2 [Ignavibacteria bacterium]|jgi:competence protein ComEC
MRYIDSLHSFLWEIKRKYPSVITVIPLAAGIAISSRIHLAQFYSGYLIYIISQFVLIGLAVIIFSRLNNKSYNYYYLFLLITFIIGYNSFQYRYNTLNEKSIESFISRAGESNIILFGKVIEQPDIRTDRIRLIISSDSISFSNAHIITEGNIIATVYKDRFKESYMEEIRYGDAVSISGKLEYLPRRHNPGEFDYGEYLKLHGINSAFTSFGYDKLKLTGGGEPGFYKRDVIYPVKGYTIRVIDSLIGGDEGEFMKGLVLGDRSNISNEIKENFVKAGVSHIIAVSGLNVAYVIIVINGILLFFPLKREYKIFITILLLIFYMNLTGNSPSIVRATIMAIVFLLSQLIERKPISYNIVAFSALIILLIDPAQLFDAGFILSYGAILSIMIFYPLLNKLMYKFKWYSSLDGDNRVHKLIIESIHLVLGTLAAQIGTLPIIAVMFNRISIISLFTNLIAIPVSNIALAIGFMVVISSAFSFWLAGVLAHTAGFLLYLLLWFIDYFANLEFSFVEVYNVDTFALLFYYVVIILLFTVTRRNYKFGLTLVVLLSANYLLYRSIFEQKNTAKLTYLDTGKSEACLISVPQGDNILINCGSSSQKFNSAQRNIIPYLKMQSIKKVDCLLLTSLDKDEFRNLFYLLRDFPVSHVMVPIYYKALFEDEHFKKYFSDKSIEYINSSQIISGNRYRVYITYDHRFVPSASMLVRFVYENASFVFSDFKDKREDFIYSLANGTGDSIGILKVPGCGSFNSISPEYIVRSNPGLILISSSDPRKKLQSKVFVKSLQLYSIPILKTDDNGAVIIETDGEKYLPVSW